MKASILFFVIWMIFGNCSQQNDMQEVSLLTPLLNSTAQEQLKLDDFYEQPIGNRQLSRSPFAYEGYIYQPDAIEAALRSATLLKAITGISGGWLPSSGNIRINTESYFKSKKIARFQPYDGSKEKKFSCNEVSSKLGGYIIPVLGLRTIEYSHECSIDMGSFSGPARLGILNYQNGNGFLAFITSGSIPVGATIDGMKGIRVNVSASGSRGLLPADYQPTKEEILKQGGILATGIQHPSIITPLINQVVRYTLESYLPIQSSLSVYAPDKANNERFSADLLTTTGGGYEFDGVVSQRYTFQSTFFALPDSSTHLGFYNNSANYVNLYSLIPAGVYPGKVVGNAGKQIEVGLRNIYFGQSNSGIYSNSNCGASAAKMACAIVGKCDDVSVTGIRNFIINDSNATGYLTWNHMDSILKHYVGSSAYTRKSWQRDITEDQIDADLDGYRAVIALIQTSELTKDTSDSTFPITKRYYSFEGNHYVVIANKVIYKGVKYYVVMDPSSWETYSVKGKTQHKGYGVYYRADELVRAMNHDDVKLQYGWRSYATVQY